MKTQTTRKKIALTVGTAVLLSASAGGVVASGSEATTGSDRSVVPPDARPLSEARILFELNATARDAGIQMLIDGDGWEWMKVYDTAGQLLLKVRADGSVGSMGVTELFYESAEPSLADLPLRDLLAMFPEGDYRVVAETVEGDTLTGIAPLTHDIPSASDVLRPAPGATTAPGPTVIRWRPHTKAGVTIDHFQIIVETDQDPLRILSVEVDGDVRRLAVPPTFLEPGTDYKLEVITVEEGLNQTITESTFSTP